jgi:hypothetical protein
VTKGAILRKPSNFPRELVACSVCLVTPSLRACCASLHSNPLWKFSAEGRRRLGQHEPLQKEHDDGSSTDRSEPQLATAPLHESHVTAKEMAQEFYKLGGTHKDRLKRAVPRLRE